VNVCKNLVDILHWKGVIMARIAKNVVPNTVDMPVFSRTRCLLDLGFASGRESTSSARKYLHIYLVRKITI